MYGGVEMQTAVERSGNEVAPLRIEAGVRSVMPKRVGAGRGTLIPLPHETERCVKTSFLRGLMRYEISQRSAAVGL